MINKNHGLILTIGLVSASALIPVSASPGIYNNQLQSWISSDCISYHSMGSSQQQSSIEDLCSAGNAGSKITSTELQRGWSNLGMPRYRPVEAISGFSGSSLDPELDTGLNAGSGMSGLGLWGNFSTGTLDNEFTNTPYKSENKVATIGFDTLVNESIIVGAAVTLDDTDVNTLFNAGSQDISRYGFTGYAAVPVNEIFSVDAAIGYSNIDTSQFRLLSAFEVAAGTPLGAAAGAVAGTSTIQSDVDSDLWFFSANLNAFKQVNNWLLSGRLGVMYSDLDNDSFTESLGAVTVTRASTDSQLGQFTVGGEISYDFKTFLEPYAGIDFIHDFESEDVLVAPGLAQPSNDDNEIITRLGFRYFGSNGVSASAEWNHNAIRDDITSNSISLTLRMDL